MNAVLTAPTTNDAAGDATASPLDLPRCDVLGVGISAVNMSLAVAQVDAWIRSGERNYVCITGVHGVMESQRDPKLKEIHNRAGMVTPDGMPMVWLNKLHGNSHVGRVYGPDLMLEICKAGIQPDAPSGGYRHFFFGGGDGVADLLSSRLREKFGESLQVVGTHCPPFRQLTDEEDAAVIQQINAAKPDVVWVGLSTPKQERWMASHLHRIHAPVMIGVGAAFDFHAGLKSQAPVWMQKGGLEWFYRLCTEPRRLAKRYLTNNPMFVACVIMQAMGLKDFGNHQDR